MVYLELAGCMRNDTVLCKHLGLLGRWHVAYSSGVASHAELLRRHTGEDCAGRAMGVRQSVSRYAACMRCATRCRRRIGDCGGCVPPPNRREQKGEEGASLPFGFALCTPVFFVIVSFRLGRS